MDEYNNDLSLFEDDDLGEGDNPSPLDPDLGEEEDEEDDKEGFGGDEETGGPSEEW
jgi:hypothetical protein